MNVRKTSSFHFQSLSWLPPGQELMHATIPVVLEAGAPDPITNPMWHQPFCPVDLCLWPTHFASPPSPIMFVNRRATWTLTHTKGTRWGQTHHGYGCKVMPQSECECGTSRSTALTPHTEREKTPFFCPDTLRGEGKVWERQQRKRYNRKVMS